MAGDLLVLALGQQLAEVPVGLDGQVVVAGHLRHRGRADGQRDRVLIEVVDGNCPHELLHLAEQLGEVLAAGPGGAVQPADQLGQMDEPQQLLVVEAHLLHFGRKLVQFPRGLRVADAVEQLQGDQLEVHARLPLLGVGFGGEDLVGGLQQRVEPLSLEFPFRLRRFAAGALVGQPLDVLDQVFRLAIGHDEGIGGLWRVLLAGGRVVLNRRRFLVLRLAFVIRGRGAWFSRLLLLRTLLRVGRRRRRRQRQEHGHDCNPQGAIL